MTLLICLLFLFIFVFGITKYICGKFGIKEIGTKKVTTVSQF